MRDKILLQLIKNLPVSMPTFHDVDAIQEYLDDKNTVTNNAIIAQQKAIAKYLTELTNEIYAKIG